MPSMEIVETFSLGFRYPTMLHIKHTADRQPQPQHFEINKIYDGLIFNYIVRICIYWQHPIVHIISEFYQCELRFIIIIDFMNVLKYECMGAPPFGLLSVEIC